MNKRFVLRLLSSPVLFASVMSMVMTGRPAHASQAFVNTNTNSVCIAAPHSATPRLVCIPLTKANRNPNKSQTLVAAVPPNQIKELDFTDAESDKAIKLFGCDCPICINALRQLQGMSQMAV